MNPSSRSHSSEKEEKMKEINGQYRQKHISMLSQILITTISIQKPTCTD
jgi:hypothetical protein